MDRKSRNATNERNRAISIKEAKSFVADALFSANVWDGAFERYYGSKGIRMLIWEIKQFELHLKENSIQVIWKDVWRYWK